MSTNHLMLLFSLLVVPVTAANTTRAATTPQFADGRPIDSRAGGNSVFAADLDGDGDLDILSAIKFHPFYSYNNTDGLGNFSAGADRFYSVTNGPKAVSAADLNGDGYIDVVAASSNNESGDLLM